MGFKYPFYIYITLTNVTIYKVYRLMFTIVLVSRMPPITGMSHLPNKSELNFQVDNFNLNFFITIIQLQIIFMLTRIETPKCAKGSILVQSFQPMKCKVCFLSNDKFAPLRFSLCRNGK